MKLNVEDEIEVLESKKENLEIVLMNLKEEEDDKTDEIYDIEDQLEHINDELDVLLSFLEDEWREEIKHETYEYWNMVL